MDDVPIGGGEKECGWDDVLGSELPADAVKAARKEEVKYMESRKIWSVRPIEECRDKTGRDPLSIRWVDTNKGTRAAPRIRSRLVVREHTGRTQLDQVSRFSAMPPLEALKLMCNLMMSRRTSKRGSPLRIGVYDVSRAHFLWAG